MLVSLTSSSTSELIFKAENIQKSEYQLVLPFVLSSDGCLFLVRVSQKFTDTYLTVALLAEPP